MAKTLISLIGILYAFIQSIASVCILSMYRFIIVCTYIHISLKNSDLSLYLGYHSFSASSSSASLPSSSISSSSIMPFYMSSIGKFFNSSASSLWLNIISILLSSASGMLVCLLLLGTGGGG